MGRITETVKVLLIINIIFFAGTMLLEESGNDLGYRLLSLWYPKHPNFQIWQPITHMFMHGGVMHLVFNMYALWAFGGPIEERFGQKKFIFFYFSAGIGAAALHLLWHHFQFETGYNAYLAAGMSTVEIDEILKGVLNSGQFFDQPSIPQDVIRNMMSAFATPAVGASGAIYGILVAFAFTFPNVSLFLMFVPVPIKAKYFVPILIALDLFSGFTGQSLFGGGIAHFAHVGGALLGFIMMWYWKKNSFNTNRWD